MCHGQIGDCIGEPDRLKLSAMAIPTLTGLIRRVFPIFLAFGVASAARCEELSLIPYPAQVAQAGPGFVLTSRTVITVAPGDASARFTARKLQKLMAQTPGLRLRIKISRDRESNTIRLVRSEGRDGQGESYELTTSPTGATLKASGQAGLYYAALTFWQVATSAETLNAKGRIPGLHIQDAPHFTWRGLLLDSARHYQPPAFIERLIEEMSELKLNVLHWHLTDDQAWRLQIKAYPRLTEVGAFRREAGFEPQALTGGFYTQAEVRRIVRYALRHHVRIVPEIDFPGHATAAIAAYPNLGAGPTPPVGPASDWGVFPNVYAPSQATLTFLHAVLDEVMRLFPDRFVHIGGDEVIKDQWKASPEAQARMKALGLKDEAQLQGWFTRQATDYLSAHGRRVMGWDEILDTEAPTTTAIMSWRGLSGAIKAVQSGRDAVLSPAPQFYFDNRQDDLSDEPPGRGLVVGLDQVYGLDIAAHALTPEQTRHILGLQANIWTEHVRTPDWVERAAFPRAAALAEKAWTPVGATSFENFERRLPDQFDRYRAEKVIFSDKVFEPRAITTQTDAATISVTVTKPSPLGVIRFRQDDRAPGPRDPSYTAPLTLNLPTQLTLATFIGTRQVSRPVHLTLSADTLHTRENHQLTSAHHALLLNLEGAPRSDGQRPTYLVDILGPAWLWKGAWMTGVDQISFEVEPLPLNFRFGAPSEHDTTPTSEAEKLAHDDNRALEVRLDRCDGPLLARLSVAKAPGVQRLTGSITDAIQGAHDLCFTFVGQGRDPLWGVGKVRLGTGAP